MIPIIQLIPQLPAARELNRWPVVEHGSSAFSEGHGAAIAMLQALGSRHGFPSFGQTIEPLSIPGFYADAAPLAVVQLFHQRLTEFIRSLTSQMRAHFAPLPKPERDELVHRNLLANLHLAEVAPLVGMIADEASGVLAAPAVAAQEEELTVAAAASTLFTTLARLAPSGFQPFQVPLTADRPPLPIEQVIPLPSFLIPYERVQGVWDQLAQFMNSITSEDMRAALNDAMAAEAGLPALQLQLQKLADAPWVPARNRDVVVRTKEVRVRVPFGSFTLHLPTGTEVARSEADPIPLSMDAALAAAPELAALPRILSTFAKDQLGVVRQIAPVRHRFIKAEFAVEPGVIRLRPGETEVSLEALVPMPPAEGFRIEWDWGDGAKTENLGLTNASHTYDSPIDVEIVVTLMTPDRELLGRVTVPVVADAGEWVGVVTQSLTVEWSDIRQELQVDATELRFTPDPTETPGVRRYVLAEGRVSAKTVGGLHACCEIVPSNPVVSMVENGFLEFQENPAGANGGPPPAHRYRGVGTMPTLVVPVPRVCPGDQQYEDSRPLTNFLQTGDESGGPVWVNSDNPNLLEGEATQVTMGPGGTKTTRKWTWRFERVFGG